jgi:hypothetical protein
MKCLGFVNILVSRFVCTLCLLCAIRGCSIAICVEFIFCSSFDWDGMMLVTYDKNISKWPKCGGANGSLRYEIELKHAANAGTAPLLIISFIMIWDDSYIIFIIGHVM